MKQHSRRATLLKAQEVKIAVELKQAEDEAKADKDEAEGHFRRAKKLDSEAKALDSARNAAAKRAKEDTA